MINAKMVVTEHFTNEISNQFIIPEEHAPNTHQKSCKSLFQWFSCGQADLTEDSSAFLVYCVSVDSNHMN